MSLLAVTDVRYSIGTRILLDGATFTVEPGEKIGLVGRNGQGKSTLMRLMAGEITCDRGQVQLRRGAKAGYLGQNPQLERGVSMREAVAHAFAELAGLHAELEQVFEAMATAGTDELERLMAKQTRLEDRIETAGGYAVDHRIDAMLHGVGFEDAFFSTPTEALSGGQRSRAALARILLEAPDLLLLDEPTNHLDIEGRRWLENFLADEYEGAVIVVSHDRWLLDRVVSRIVEVEHGDTHEYPGNYHAYIDQRRERQVVRQRVHEKQLDRIRAEEQFIRKYKAGQRAKQARGRESRLERFKKEQLVERPMELDVMRLNLPRPPRSGDVVLSAEGLSKRYGDLVLFEGFDLRIARGDRIGIVGPNGIGKTTLVKCLLGEEQPDAGTVRTGSRVSTGWFRQLHDHLDPDLMVWQYLQSVIVGLDGQAKASEQQARDLAGAFLFSGAEQDKTLGDVSGGERARAMIAGLVAGAHNLLVLDEPTNHLDIPSAERLEQALSPEGGYDGALLLISHDRALLEACCDRLVVFGLEGGPRIFDGTWTDWVRRQEQAEQQSAALREEEARRAAASAKSKAEQDRRAAAAKAPTPKKKSPLSHLSVEEIEARIERTELRLGELDAAMGEAAMAGDGDRIRELTQEREALAAELGPLEEEWASRAEA